MKKKILVVDDEKEACRFLKDYLDLRGFEVDVAFDGAKASELLDSQVYDYIFFDCNMPELSGIELIKVIRAKNPKAKAIMVSGYDLIDEDFSRNAGVDMFLKKPISLEAVKEIVENG